MKPIGYFLAALLGCAGAPLWAQCSGAGTSELSQGQIRTLVGSNLVCGRAVKPGYPGDALDRFQEEHVGNTSGAVIDFKRGNGHPVDPRKTVGSWSAAGGNPATITHVYGTLSFTWKVVQNPSSVSFCTTAGVEHVRAFVVPINASLGCNGIYPP